MFSPGINFHLAFFIVSISQPKYSTCSLMKITDFSLCLLGLFLCFSPCIIHKPLKINIQVISKSVSVDFISSQLQVPFFIGSFTGLVIFYYIWNIIIFKNEEILVLCYDPMQTGKWLLFSSSTIGCTLLSYGCFERPKVFLTNSSSLAVLNFCLLFIAEFYPVLILLSLTLGCCYDLHGSTPKFSINISDDIKRWGF